MIKSGEYLVENHHPYYSSNQSNSQTTLQPPPPPPSAPTTHMVVPARGVKRPRTICPKPKQEIELMPSDQYYCDDQTMTIVKESEGLFEDQDGEFFAIYLTFMPSLFLHLGLLRSYKVGMSLHYMIHCEYIHKFRT